MVPQLIDKVAVDVWVALFIHFAGFRKTWSSFWLEGGMSIGTAVMALGACAHGAWTSNIRPILHQVEEVRKKPIRRVEPFVSWMAI
jgi:hypothetical protein